MRWRRVLRASLATLCAGFLLGMSCGSGEGPGAPSASLQLEVLGPFPAFGNEFFLQVYVVVDSALPFQAYDLDVRWTPEQVVSQVGVLPVSEFDDDGSFFGSPLVDAVAGEVTNVIDLRRGEGTSIAGPVRVATMVMLASGGQDVTISADGKVARPDGILFDTASAQTVVPIPSP